MHVRKSEQRIFPHSLFQKKEKPKSNCTAYDDDANVSKTVIPFMLGNASVSKSDVTFATHLSITRLDMLEEVMNFCL